MYTGHSLTLLATVTVYIIILQLIIGVGTGGARRALAPRFLGRGGRKEVSVPPPHFWARTYLKIPPRSLLFHPYNSTVLTPNQSVRRCFEKFIGVGTGGGGAPSPPPPPPVFLQCVCVGGGAGPSCWKPLGASFSVSSDIIFCIISMYQSKNKP